MTKQTKNPAAHTAARFHDEAAARAHLEAVRWPNGPVCPHCGGIERNSRLTAQVKGKGARPGLLFCGDCRSQFSVTVGTVFEDSKVPLHKWVYANHLICTSKKGISSKQLERMLKVSYKTAWFMSHRLRLAMAKTPTGPLGGSGKIVEVDETYYGNKKGVEVTQGSGKHKHRIFSLVERNGDVRSFHVASVSAANLKPIMRAQIDQRTHLMTDEATRYWKIGKEFAKHSSVNHARKEYGRGEVTTNTVEGYFSILKRGLTGIYQHVSEQHLQRYVTEFDFRYNNRESQGINDEMRATAALKGIEGKRLTYRRTHASAA
jgi:transposase-like protein